MVIKNYKKLISIILTICVVSFFAITAAIICFNIQNNQNKNPNTFAAAELGTAENPYLISSEDQFYNFLNNFGWNDYDKPDGYFKLTTDINFSYDEELFGNEFDYETYYSKFRFNGTFDGDNHSITILAKPNYYIRYKNNVQYETKAYGGLFLSLGYEAEIKNINLTYNAFFGGQKLSHSLATEIDYGDLRGSIFGAVSGFVEEGAYIANSIFSCGAYDFSAEGTICDAERGDVIRLGIVGFGKASVDTCFFANMDLCVNEAGDFPLDREYQMQICAAGHQSIATNCVAIMDTFYVWTDGYNYLKHWENKIAGTEKVCLRFLVEYNDLEDTKSDYIAAVKELVSTWKGDYSSVGGEEEVESWYYTEHWGPNVYDVFEGDEFLNYGIPYLRTFVNWKEIEFKMFIEDAGHVDSDKIYIPNDVELQQKYEGVNKIIILGQIISVNLEPGNKIHSWRLEGGSTYVVYTLTAPIILRFYQASVQEPNPDDIIATPDGGYSKPDPYENGVNVSSTTYYIEATTSVQASTTSGYLIYNFTDKDGVAREIRYNISGFTVIKNNADSQISENVKTIKPLLKIKTGASLYITFVGNANTTNKTTSTVDVSESPKLLSAKFTNRRGISGSKITFTCGSEEFVYEANYDYTIISFTVDTLLNSTTYTKDLSQRMIECTITVQVAELLKVQYHDPDAINGKTPAEKSGDNIMQVIKGEEVKVSIRDNALIYTYSNGTYSYLTKYTPNKYYVLDEENSVVSDFTVDDWMGIKPVYFRSVVPIKLKLQGEGSITVVENANDIVVTQSGNEINFEVEFGTELIVTPDANYNKNENENIYTFVYDNETLVVVKITKLNNKYYLEDNGINNHESITFDDECENVSIIPIIQLKEYNVEIK